MIVAGGRRSALAIAGAVALWLSADGSAAGQTPPPAPPSDDDPASAPEETPPPDDEPALAPEETPPPPDDDPPPPEETPAAEEPTGGEEPAPEDADPFGDDLSDEDALLLEMSEEELAAELARLEADTPEEPLDDMALDEVELVLPLEDTLRTGGGVTVLDEDDLAAFDYPDPTDIVRQVPGVFVRVEDGFGLRPNIGIRGVSAERSRKITLMEDGVLFGPAPYSAPAAYYFPLMSRIVGVEVFKGPAAIPYGPQTVAGSINFLTREIPAEGGGAIDLAFGRFLSQRYHLHYAVVGERWGVMFEGGHLASDGFKTIDGARDDTGFERSEGAITGSVQSDPAARVYNRLELRVGYSRESSRETYLGLTDQDFRDDPNRRYAASQRDQFNWWRTQLRIRHRLEVGDHFRVLTDLYRHDFDRTWFRLDRFRDDTQLFPVLRDPTGARQDRYEILTGAQDDDPANPDDDLLIRRNERRFVSQGIQTRVRFDVGTGPVTHDVEIGLRLHHDRVDRDQPVFGFRMIDQTLVPDGQGEIPDSRNVGEALAFAAHAAWAIDWEALTVTPGVRLEVIATDFEDELDGDTESATQVAVLPGVGATYEILPRLSLLAGVHRGFSPNSPGNIQATIGDATEDADPEFSVNYEAGARFAIPSSGTLAEVVGFFNDYSNLLGECTGASGCSGDLLNRQFNGGEARIFGVEAVGAHTFETGCGARIPFRLVYTYINAEFENAFQSDFPEWGGTDGQVESGDRIPYVPTHQLRVQGGVDRGPFRGNVGLTYVGEMLEEAGQGDGLLTTDDFFLLDALARVALLDGLDVYVRGENLLNQRPIASRRPFGARPIAPLTVMLGLRAALPGIRE